LSDSGVIVDDFKHRHERLDTLVWQASTALMTPRIDPQELLREQQADPIAFAREYLAELTSGDTTSFLPGPDIEMAVREWRELAPDATSFYVGALDASGLSGGDIFSFGIASSGDEGMIVSVLRGWKRTPAAEVCDEISALCKQFRISAVEGDQYSHTFLAELLRQRGISLHQLTFTQQSKAEIYFDLKYRLSQGKIALPNHAEMVRQLRALQSQRSSGGAYKIGAPRSSGAHDDYPTVVALLANRVKRSSRKFIPPSVFEVRVGSSLSQPRPSHMPPPPLEPVPWTDTHEGVDLNDPFQGDERFWHKL
jgi:hypothetical protein